MEKDYLISLTKSLYQLTLLFPKKEPLRYKMRELADEILADFIIDPKSETLEKLEILDSFFEIVKVQNWVSKDLILLLQKEYSKLKENLSSNKNQDSILNERQNKILEVLKEKEKVQVREIKNIFPQVSKRTLRRDFEKLVNQGLVERIGEKINTFYQLKDRTNRDMSQIS
jgi:DNA-binding HxlR family transcriptional regulator